MVLAVPIGHLRFASGQSASWASVQWAPSEGVYPHFQYMIVLRTPKVHSIDDPLAPVIRVTQGGDLRH